VNISTYIFGLFDNGYSQYPNDYTRSIFQNFYENSTAPAQILVHRDGAIIYYGYIRKLENRRYIGFSVVLNSLMLTDFKEMFSIFEKTITNLVVNGNLLQFDDKGNIVPTVQHLYLEHAEISHFSKYLRNEFARLETSCKVLPPISYEIAKDEIRKFPISNDEDEIIEASSKYSYCVIFKQTDFDGQTMGSYRSTLHRLNEEKEALEKKNSSLKSDIISLRNKQRNTTWIAVLSVVVAILGGILYFKVLNPAEVTKYETSDFLYYGPLNNKRPHGEGVAFYPTNDQYGRRYYIGNFKYGERQDSNAMLYYQNGDYFYGSMFGDKFQDGIFYSNSDNAHFEGRFVNNKPYDGTWYIHEISYTLKEGQIINK